MDEESGVGIGVEELEGLRARAALADESSLRAKELERQLAFQVAGVDTTTAAGQVFARGYEGELSPEAVREVAAGFFRAEVPEPTAQAAMAVAAAGGAPEPEDKAAAYARCNSESELMAMATQLGTPTAWNRPS